MNPRKEESGTKNIVGLKISEFRMKHKIKQKEFLAILQTMGFDISPTSLSRIEGQHRLVQDFEVAILAEALGITADELLCDYNTYLTRMII